MLCPECRRQVIRGAAFCGSCGAPLGDARAPLELVLAGGARIPLVEDLTIGRGPSATLRLDDPSVSRVHARLNVDGASATIEDLESKNGTYLRGNKLDAPAHLSPGDEIRVGSVRLVWQGSRPESATDTYHAAGD